MRRLDLAGPWRRTCVGAPSGLHAEVVPEVGANNQALLDDPLHIGHCARRLVRTAYGAFLDARGVDRHGEHAGRAARARRWPD